MRFRGWSRGVVVAEVGDEGSAVGSNCPPSANDGAREDFADVIRMGKRDAEGGEATEAAMKATPEQEDSGEGSHLRGRTKLTSRKRGGLVYEALGRM